MRCLFALLALFALLFVGTGARAQAPYNNPKTPTGWAWAKVRKGEIADFDARCGKPLDPGKKAGWVDPCRQIPAQFLVDVLTEPRFLDQIPRQHIVALRGARINGTIELENAEIADEVWIDKSRVEGDLILSDSRWSRPLSFSGSTLTGMFLAERVRTRSIILLNNHADIQGLFDLHGAQIGDLYMKNATFAGEVELSSTKIADLDMEGSSFAGPVEAPSLAVENGVRMGEHADFGSEVSLMGAKIGGDLEMARSSFEGAVYLIGVKVDGSVTMESASFARLLNADSLTVGSGLFMRDRASFRGEVNLHDAKASQVEMEGSSFAEAVNANSVTVKGAILMSGHATFGGEVNLVGARVGSNLEMEGSSFKGAVIAGEIVVDGALLMNGHATFRGEVNMVDAKVAEIDMDSSVFEGPVNGNSLNVTGALLMHDHATFGSEVNLVTAKIGSNLDMESSSFKGAVTANSADVEGSLLMSGHATFGGKVSLGSAIIGSSLDMSASSFAAGVNASGVTVKGVMRLDNRATISGEVNLASAKLGDLQMAGSDFSGGVNASSVSVAGNFQMGGGAKFKRGVTLGGTKIGGVLDLRTATAARLDFSDADAGQLWLGGLKWWCAGGLPPAGAKASASGSQPKLVQSHWTLGDDAWQMVRCDRKDAYSEPVLILRNFHVADFQDDAKSWPPRLDLEGFRYDRLGGYGGEGRNDMRRRSASEWADWLARDRTFSTQPYTELSDVLAAAGRRDTADAIQIAGRERERAETCAGWGRFGACAWLTFLSYVAGYGIGLYTFAVLAWVVGITVLGADVLWYSERARRRGLLWRLAASLHRLLPVIELSKEFTDFFDNPPPQPGEAPNLDRLQVAYFAGHAIAGWVLGFFLLAAMGGIIQKS